MLGDQIFYNNVENFGKPMKEKAILAFVNLFIYISCLRMSIPNLSDIKVPSGPSTKKITQKLKEKIKDGTCKIGDFIVPRKFEKISLREEKLVEKFPCVILGKRCS